MLTNVKRALLKIKLVNISKVLCEQIESIPVCSSVQRLTVILGHLIRHDENIYEELPEDCQDIIDEANPTIYVDLPSKYW